METYEQGVESSGHCRHSASEPLVGFPILQAEVETWEGGQRASPVGIKIWKWLLWLKGPKMTTSNAGKHVGGMEILLHSCGDAKWYRCFGRPFGSFLRNHGPTIPFSNCAPTFPQVSWKLVSIQKPVCACLYLWQLYYNCQDLEATQMSFSRQRHNLWYIQTSKYYSAIERNELPSHKEMNAAEWNKAIWKGYRL